MAAPLPVRVSTGTSNCFVSLTASDQDNPAVLLLNLGQPFHTVVDVATGDVGPFAPSNLSQLGVSSQGPDGRWYVASYNTLVRFDNLADSNGDFFSEFNSSIYDFEFGPNGDLYVLTADLRISRLNSQGTLQAVSEP